MREVVADAVEAQSSREIISEIKQSYIQLKHQWGAFLKPSDNFESNNDTLVDASDPEAKHRLCQVPINFSELHVTGKNCWFYCSVLMV